MSEGFSYIFSAIRGSQAGRDYYVAMCPLRLIPKIFLFDEEEIPAELRAQRTLNRSRVPEIAQYLVENREEYVFSALTASVDGVVEFRPAGDEDTLQNLGELQIPMSSRFLINDGQHRRAAIEEALKLSPDLGDETIAVVFFVDRGLERSQQLFADLNKHAVRPTKSLGILYDLRDPQSKLARRLADKVEVFRGLTETEKTTISNRSIKLFTLSGIYQGTSVLLGKAKHGKVTTKETDLAVEFWNEVGSQIPDWVAARKREVAASQLRGEFIHAHGIALHAIGLMGHTLIAEDPKSWKTKLKKLRSVDWSRSNLELWEGRALVGGRVSKAHNNVLLTSAVLKKAVGLGLTPEEERAEVALMESRQG